MKSQPAPTIIHDLVPNTDWQDLVFHNALHAIPSVFSIRSNRESLSTILPWGISSRMELLINQITRGSRLNLIIPTSWLSFLKLGNNITIAPYKQQNAPNVTYSAYRAQPLLEPYLPDGSYAGVYNVGNPLAQLEYSNDFNKGLRGVGNVLCGSKDY